MLIEHVATWQHEQLYHHVEELGIVQITSNENVIVVSCVLAGEVKSSLHVQFPYSPWTMRCTTSQLCLVKMSWILKRFCHLNHHIICDVKNKRESFWHCLCTVSSLFHWHANNIYDTSSYRRYIILQTYWHLPGCDTALSNDFSSSSWYLGSSPNNKLCVPKM